MEVEGLKNLIREFRKRNSALKTACYNILCEHRINTEILPIIAQEVDDIDFMCPIIVIHHSKLVAAIRIE
ncbi:hypothetical protein D3C78_1813710 [compost metagenome]